MAFCAQCGRDVAAHLSNCPHCGAPQARAATPAAYAAAAPAEGAAPGGPVGQTRSPGMVIVLVLVTFGIYGLIYWWNVSKEADAYAQRPGHAHGRVKLGLILLGVGLLVMLVASFMMIGAAFSASETPDPEAAAAGALAGGALFMFAAFAVILAGSVLLMMGQWRVWKTIEEDERRRGVPNPLSPVLQLVFMLLPYVNLITMFIAYYRTQKGHNEMWAQARAGPAPVPRAY